MTCFTATTVKAATEIEQIEAESAEAYKILMTGCMTFVHTATVQAKNQLWNDLANSAEGRGLLQKMNKQHPRPLGRRPAGRPGSHGQRRPGTQWLKTFQRVG